jgi:hypothetical protein
VQFAKVFVEGYRVAWARHEDITEAQFKQALPANGPMIFATHPVTALALWKARQLADRLGVPYDFFTRHAVELPLQGRSRHIFQPNQLYSSKFADDIHKHVLHEWHKTTEVRWRYSAAYLRVSAASPAGQRVSMRTLLPSIQPNCCRPCRNGPMRA